IQLGAGGPGTLSSGPVCIGTLPFAAQGPTFTFNALSVSYWSNLRAETGGTTVVTAHIGDPLKISMFRVPISNTPQNPILLNAQDLNPFTQIILGGSYIAAQ